MTEPGAGSDLQGIRTSAVDKGDHYVLNGSKTFISNGIMSDLVIVVCRTDPDAGHQGISLLVVERGMEGFERGRNLDKMGMKAQDTAELFFDNVLVPKENLLGEEGSGFIYLMQSTCPRSGSRSPPSRSPRWSTSWSCASTTPRSARRSASRSASSSTTASCSPRWPPRSTSPGCSSTTASSSSTRARSTPALASMAKWWTTELQKKFADQGVQLHGGYGYMSEYPISKAYTDSRIQTIYGGTTEIQKEIIGRMLGV